jgi:hypothetical protein
MWARPDLLSEIELAFEHFRDAGYTRSSGSDRHFNSDIGIRCTNGRRVFDQERC